MVLDQYEMARLSIILLRKVIRQFNVLCIRTKFTYLMIMKINGDYNGTLSLYGWNTYGVRGNGGHKNHGTRGNNLLFMDK